MSHYVGDDYWGRPSTPAEVALVEQAQEVALVAAVTGVLD
jgi:hypothetical protein